MIGYDEESNFDICLCDKSFNVLGYTSTNITSIIHGPTISTLLNNKDKKVGIIDIQCRKEVNYSMIDFIKAGLTIDFRLAIDGTGSNGIPTNNNSLHCLYNKNPYRTAIEIVGPILEEYDSDKLIKTIVFGAKDKYGKVNHNMPLNGNNENSYIRGISDVLLYYTKWLNECELCGPTMFHPLLNQTITDIEMRIKENPFQYFFLLIISDGVIEDMKETIISIVKASKLPLSIVILGVGNADFTNMEILDGDEESLVDSYGQKASRDIVQFVSMNKFRYKDSNEFNYNELEKAILEEIPYQVEQYMKINNIIPHELNTQVIPSAPPALYTQYIYIPI